MSKQATLGLTLTCLVIAALTLPVVEWLTTFFAWVQANPTIAWAVFVVFYICAVVLMLPGSLLTLGAGYLFGLGWLRHRVLCEYSWGNLRLRARSFSPGTGWPVANHHAQIFCSGPGRG